MNKKIIIANFKLNGNTEFIKKYINEINKINKNKIKYEICISPPIIYTYLVSQLNKKSHFSIASQNIDYHDIGSYTGDISPLMLKEINVKYSIIGHSERRKYHKENDKIIFKKILTAKKHKIKPIICIGENLNEYINQKSLSKCINQIKYLNKNNTLNNCILAYEPIWAIGTGKHPDILHIESINKNIKKYINNKKINNYKILYGGSINYKNYKIILNSKHIDGLLIGNASLNIKEFINILKN